MAKKQLSNGIEWNRETVGHKLVHSWQLYVLMLPALILILTFAYRPMYGLIIAFKDFRVRRGIMGSDWVGWKHFQAFFSNGSSINIIKNTVVLSVEQLLITFPIPVIFALMINNVRSDRTRKTLQTISYAPYFVSVVVVVSIMNVILAPGSGFVNLLLQRMGSEPLYLTSEAKYFRPMYIISTIWQSTGFNAIVFIAALTGISPEYHEAAIVDGAGKLKRTLYIDLPLILPTIIIMLILSVGRIMTVGYEKAYLMQSSMNLSVSEIISTYVYKSGLQSAQYSFATAVGLFNAVVNLVLLVTTNWITKHTARISLF